MDKLIGLRAVNEQLIIDAFRISSKTIDTFKSITRV